MYIQFPLCFKWLECNQVYHCSEFLFFFSFCSTCRFLNTWNQFQSTSSSGFQKSLLLFLALWFCIYAHLFGFLILALLRPPTTGLRGNKCGLPVMVCKSCSHTLRCSVWKYIKELACLGRSYMIYVTYVVQHILLIKLWCEVKFYSHQLMHFFIQLCISLLSYIKIT